MSPPVRNSKDTPLWRRVRARAARRVDRAVRELTLDAPVIEGALRKLDSTLSLHSIRARVIEVRQETHDVKTFVLRPNARFESFKPGSYVNIKVRVGGRRHSRSYSISSSPTHRRAFSITVKRVPGGTVSNWLLDHARVGLVMPVSEPAGAFVLPEVLPPALLMLSAGSGITPVMSMLRHLVREGIRLPVTFVHFARSPRDIIFHQELLSIAEAAPNVRLVLCVEAADDSWKGLVGRFSRELLESVAPNYRDLDTFLCGPSGFMKAVVQTFQESGAELSRLRYERFGVDFDASMLVGHGQLVRFAKSGGESISSTPRTILDEAERLGIVAEWSCRAGNCGTCRCKKLSGVVTDLTTGLDSGPGEEDILACVSLPRGAVEVDL